MIKRLVQKVQTLLVRGLTARARRQPKRIPRSEHGIARERVSRAALRVCETLQKAGFEAYIVGGAVRGAAFYGKPPPVSVGSSAAPQDQWHVGQGRLLPSTAVDQFAA
ncbi:MAG: hypothetical protein N2483_06825, partial [Burkholderiaceae bacterium]|nr:hypothetical protein [Burkholderiaceae bacterium]